MKLIIFILASFAIIVGVPLWMGLFDIIDRWEEERELNELLETLEPMNEPSDAEVPVPDLAVVYLLVADGETDVNEKAYWYKCALNLLIRAARGGENHAG